MTKTDLKSMLKDPSLLCERAYINGEWVDGDNGTFEVTNPARGKRNGRNGPARNAPPCCAASLI